jgi:hypothetical protein
MFDAFDHEHNGTTGVHDNSSIIMSQYEIGTATTDGTDDYNIFLSNSALDCDFVFMWLLDDDNPTPGVQFSLFGRSESMTGDNTARFEQGAAGFDANYIQSIGTGVIQSGNGWYNYGSGTIFGYLAIGV